MTSSRGPRGRRREYKKHGLTALKSAVNKLGGRVIDRRTTLGKALDAWRGDLIEDLGGPGAISTQQRSLVDLAVRSKLMLDSIDAWILTQRTLVNARKRSLLPVVRERASLAGQFQTLMKDLGLERRSREVESYSARLARTAREATP